MKTAWDRILVLGTSLLAATTAKPSAPMDQPAPLPAGATARMGTTSLRHGDGIFFAAYLPGGKKLVTAGLDNTVRLWDLTTGREVRRFAQPKAGSAERPVAPTEDQARARVQAWMRQRTKPNAALALAHDGRLLAAACGGNGTLWETATGKTRLTLTSPQTDISDILFSRDDARLVTVALGKSVAIWDLKTGKCLKEVRNETPEGVHVDGPFFACGAVAPDLAFHAWQEFDLRKGTATLRVKRLDAGKDGAVSWSVRGPITSLAFSADGRNLAWTQAGVALHVAATATGKETFSPDRARPSGPAVKLVFSPDGKTVAVGRLPSTVELRDAVTGKQRYTLDLPTPPDDGNVTTGMEFMRIRSLDGALAFSPDGKNLAVSLRGSSTIRRFDVATGKELGGPASGPRAPVAALAVSADGKTLLTGGRGEPVRAWDVTSGREKRQVALPKHTSRVSFSAGGKRVAVLTVAAVVVLDATTGTEVLRLTAKDLGLETSTSATGVVAIALSPDGNLLAIRRGSSAEVRLWDVGSKKPLRNFSQATAAVLKDAGVTLTEVSGVSTPDLLFSPDGAYLAGAGAKWQLCLWKVATGKPAWELALPAGQVVERFAFSPGGSCLAALNTAGSVTLYETATGQERCRLGKGTKADVAGVAMSFGGTSFALRDRSDSPQAVTLSPNGRYVAVASHDPVIHVWDVLTGARVGEFRGHEGGVVALRFTPDGRHLVSGGLDTTALVWDMGRRKTNAAAAGGPVAEARDALWSDLGGRDARKAFTALRRFAAAPREAAAFLTERLRPVPAVPPEKIRNLVKDLGNKSFAVRKEAEAELAKLGSLAEAELRGTLAQDAPPELRQRVERMLERVTGQAASNDLLRGRRAVELLGMLGTPDARRLLGRLAAGDPAATLTREARAALERAGRASRPSSRTKRAPRALARRIDALVGAKLKAAGVAPAPRADDAEFLRRLSLDLNGRIPTVVQLRDFLDDTRTDKRWLWIDELMAGEENAALYVRHFTNVWRRTILSRTPVQPAAAGSLEGWLSREFKAHTPYDRIVRNLLTDPEADAFFVANGRKPEQLTAATSRLFRGVKLECVQCHDDRTGGSWKRPQFWELAAFFTPDAATKRARGKPVRIRIGDTTSWVDGRFPDGSRPDWARGDARTLLAGWLTARDNPWFARAAVNRVWHHFFGTGLVEPVDAFGSSDHDPSHPDLLNELAQQFVAHDFDLKYLIRAIAGSATYQRTSRLTHPGQKDPRLFARARVRAMSAEQLFDSLSLATGYDLTAASSDSSPYQMESRQTRLLEKFEQVHDTPAESQATIPQALAMMNSTLMDEATDPKKSRTLAALLAGSRLTPARQIAELYLATLSRSPRSDERDRFVKYVEAGDRRQALRDVFWSLLNSTEFISNH